MIIEIAKKLIIKNFSFLEENGYKYTCKFDDDPTFIESLYVKYINTLKNREITISYHQGKVYEDIKYSFGASITRMPYSDPLKDFFALNIYLDSIGLDFITSLVNHFDEAEANEILQKIAQALKTHAGDIIDCAAWEEGYYPKWNT